MRNGYFPTLLLALPLGLGLFAQACNPLAQAGSGGGKCTTTDGNVVDTYTVFGAWKKVSGYDSPRTKAELELNYDVLLMQAGTPFCVTEVVNQAQGDTTIRGTYVQDVKTKQLTFTYEAGEKTAGSTALANFAFSGSCDQTVMTLSYEDGTLEKFQVLSKDTSQINCNPQSNP